MGLLEAKVALVVGGTSGIGRTTALAFAREGAKVVLTGRREAEGSEVVRSIQERGGEALFVLSDITREADVKRAVDTTVSTFGTLDIAFNNAGSEGVIGPLFERTSSDYDQVMDTNVRGLFFAMKHEINSMRAKGQGIIVNNASTAGHVAVPSAALYTASKHAVIGMTKAVAYEMAPLGIRVNAVSPGGVETELLQRFISGMQAAKQPMVASIPVGRLGRTEEVAETVVWLCSPAASYIVGHSICIDGGLTLS
jgi:NAD(P)-dependent dehydrogenase (short-subunit alcohol dehydrogenase family)